MNKLIANPKQTFLLGAGLDILHHESTEWLEDIAFWKDELSFFEKLLHRSEPILEDLKNNRNTLELLENLHGDFIKQLQEDVIEHEKFLVKLEHNEEGHSDWEYREKHRRLKNRMNSMTQEFRSFKKVVFDYVKSL